VKVLVDTNVISELRKGDRADPRVAAWARGLGPEDVATSVIVLAEIRRGIELKRLRDPRQADALDAWFDRLRDGLGPRVLPVDDRIAEAWARLSVPDPVPLIDGLIAATALVHGLVLATRNVADMRRTGAVLVDPFAAVP
jgi:predicted nucleic acid-binding protein